MSYKKIDNVENSILDRISEQEVNQWLAAKLNHLREKLPAHSVELDVWFRDFCGEQYYDAGWSLHGAGKVSGSHPDIETAFRELRNEIMDNPKAQADENRRKARRLLEEADELEKAALA